MQEIIDFITGRVGMKSSVSGAETNAAGSSGR
jgi:hypothetical protein